MKCDSWINFIWNWYLFIYFFFLFQIIFFSLLLFTSFAFFSSIYQNQIITLLSVKFLNMRIALICNLYVRFVFLKVFSQTINMCVNFCSEFTYTTISVTNSYTYNRYTWTYYIYIYIIENVYFHVVLPAGCQFISSSIQIYIFLTYISLLLYVYDLLHPILFYVLKSVRVFQFIGIS